jgi:hypothetical protein
MPERTEDLLSIRDGEPVDVTLLQRVLRDPRAREALREYSQTRRALRNLPPIAAPEHSWWRLRDALEVADQRRTRPWAQAIGLAIVVLLVALGAAEYVSLLPPDDAREANAVVSPFVTVSANGSRDVRELIAESVQLERILTAMPEQHGLMQAGTASTIVGLEDQIASIDAQLSLGAAAGIDAQHREAMWRERVDLMNALVRVRYAHAQRFVF